MGWLFEGAYAGGKLVRIYLSTAVALEAIERVNRVHAPLQGFTEFHLSWVESVDDMSELRED